MNDPDTTEVRPGAGWSMVDSPRSPNESVTASERANVNTTRITFSDRVSVIALILATAAIGVLIMMPSVIDSKIQAGAAKAHADMQQQVSDAKATATAGNQHARVALDKVEDFRAKLAAKGIDIPPLDGH